MSIVSGLLTSHKMESGGGGMPGPPFDPTSAAEGISIDPVTGKIVWGSLDGTGPGAASDITASREIEMSGNFMNLRNTGAGIYSALGGGELDLIDLLNNINSTFQPGIALMTSDADLFGFRARNNTTSSQGIFSNLSVSFDDGGGGSAQVAISSLDVADPAGDTASYGAAGLVMTGFPPNPNSTNITPGRIDMSIPSASIQYLWTQDRISCLIGAGISQDDIVFNGDGFTFNLGSGASHVNMNSAFGIATDAPAGGVGGATGGWQLGNPIASAAVLDTTQYVEVNIGGLLLKLALIV